MRRSVVSRAVGTPVRTRATEVARPRTQAQTGRVLSLIYGPVVALAVVTLFIFLLRWTFRRGSSLVAPPARSGDPNDYGLLQVVAAPGSFAQAELIRERLVAVGIRATLAPTTEGPRVLVFPDDARTARALLRHQR